MDGGFRITWLGHSAFQVDTPGGKRILIDPWLSENPACPPDRKTVDRCDLILVTHGHDDHLGDTVGLAKSTGAKVVCIFEVGAWLTGKGVEDPLMMNKGGTIRVHGVEATMVNAHHSSGIWDTDHLVYGGEPAGYVVTLENGFRFYHAGDTCLFGDMALIRELYRPDLAMLPIGDVFTMGPLEAAHAIRLLGVKHVIPMHFGTFPALTGTPEALAERTRDVAGLTIHALRPGESVEGDTLRDGT